MEAESWPEPAPGEREAWESIVEDAMPKWRSVPEGTVLYRVCEKLYAAMRDYYDGSGGPPNLHSFAVAALAWWCEPANFLG